jgi:hypothetical protein
VPSGAHHLVAPIAITRKIALGLGILLTSLVARRFSRSHRGDVPGK